MTGNAKTESYIEKFGDAVKCRTYLKKEAYWQCLLDQAKELLQEIRADNVELPEGFEGFYEQQRNWHISAAFPELWKDMKPSVESEKQPEILQSAKRLVYR